MELDWCSSNDLHSINTPFEHTYTKTVTIKSPPITSQKNCFGFVLCTDEINKWVFISDILPKSDAAKSIGTSKMTMTNAIGSYITAINEYSIFTIAWWGKSKFVNMLEDNISFSITLAAPWKLPAADRDHELIELDLTAPSFTVPSPDYDVDDDDVEHIASLSIKDIRHLTSLRTQLSAE